MFLSCDEPFNIEELWISESDSFLESVERSFKGENFIGSSW